jgi:hypothetical protein
MVSLSSGVGRSSLESLRLLEKSTAKKEKRNPREKSVEKLENQYLDKSRSVCVCARAGPPSDENANQHTHTHIYSIDTTGYRGESVQSIRQPNSAGI